MFAWLTILCCNLMCVVGRWSHHASLSQAKRDIKSQKFRSQINNAQKGNLKTWGRWNSQTFQGNCHWTTQGGFTAPHMNHQLQGLMCWSTLDMAYGHKTQSLMKNRGQQKCWDKALALYQVCIWLLLLNILPKLRYLVGRNYI